MTRMLNRFGGPKPEAHGSFKTTRRFGIYERPSVAFRKLVGRRPSMFRKSCRATGSTCGKRGRTPGSKLLAKSWIGRVGGPRFRPRPSIVRKKILPARRIGFAFV